MFHVAFTLISAFVADIRFSPCFLPLRSFRCCLIIFLAAFMLLLVIIIILPAFFRLFASSMPLRHWPIRSWAWDATLRQLLISYWPLLYAFMLPDALHATAIHKLSYYNAC